MSIFLGHFLRALINGFWQKRIKWKLKIWSLGWNSLFFKNFIASTVTVKMAAKKASLHIYGVRWVLNFVFLCTTVTYVTKGIKVLASICIQNKCFITYKKCWWVFKVCVCLYIAGFIACKSVHFLTWNIHSSFFNHSLKSENV